MENKTALQRIRFLIMLFILALSAAGLTAIPLQWELALLNQWLGTGSFGAQVLPSLAEWISRVNNSVQKATGNTHFLPMERIGWHSRILSLR